MARQFSYSDWAKQILGPSIMEGVSAFADRTLPECEYCHRKAIPVRCTLCGSFSCQAHGYHSVERREGLCHKCFLDLLGDAGDAEGDMSHWEILGIPPGSPLARIEQAFRRKAKECHPDHYPDDIEKAQKFRALQWAREQARQEVP